MEATVEWQDGSYTTSGSLHDSNQTESANVFPSPNFSKDPHQSVNKSTHGSFAPFSRLPLEIRNQIWKASLTIRIVKWIRVNDENSFDVPSRSLALLSVNRESREAAFFYGEYQTVSSSPRTLYFSPILDYLFFDPGWIDLVGLQANDAKPEPVQTLLPAFQHTRKLMVNPNYTDHRKTPTALFEKFRHTERVLVAIDEKSIGFHSEYIWGTIYDIAKYYEFTAKRRIPDIKKPYIAVGCLGWVGIERRNLHHGREDHRQLVAVFENDREMDAHTAILRGEEWRFVQERFKQGRPKFVLNFRQRGDELGCPAPTIEPLSGDVSPPSYLEAATWCTGRDAREVGPPTESTNGNQTNGMRRASRHLEEPQTSNPGAGGIEELPDYDQIA